MNMQKGRSKPEWLKRTSGSAKNDPNYVSVAELLKRIEKLILKHNLDKDPESLSMILELHNAIRKAFDLSR